MAYSRVQKSAKHTSSQKKQSRIVPPPIDIQTQADSLPSTGLTGFGLPSKAERDAIRRSLFEKWAGTGQLQAKAEVPQPESESEVVARGEMSTEIKANQHQEASELLGTMGLPIQTKLTIGAPGDKYEQEADRVAAQVVNQINAPAPQQSSQSQPVQREAIPEEDDLQMKPLISTIQREEVPEEEEELQMKPAVQLQASVGGMAATDELETAIQQARSGGQPLAEDVREPMEQAMGADFSRVKIHTDAQANQLNQTIQTRAFTTGQDVFFRQGEYNPGSRGGQELLAHELTHVVQQNGKTPYTGTVSRYLDQLVQRAIGFEFEFGTWKTSYQKDDQPLKKGDEIINGEGYKVEGEDAQEGTSAIEVVTDAYTTLEEAEESVAAAQNLMKDIYNKKAKHLASEHKGSSNVFIEPGKDKGKMQASPAVSLDKLPELYKQGAGQSYKKFVQAIDNHLQNDDIKNKYIDGKVPSAELKGLVMLLVSYLEQGSRTNILSYPKAAFTIMARTSFKKMFELVPEQQFFSQEGNIDKWVELVLGVASKIVPNIGTELVKPVEWRTKEYRKTICGIPIPGTKIKKEERIPEERRQKSLEKVGQAPVLGMPFIGVEPLPGDKKEDKYKLKTTRDEWLRNMPNQDLISKETDKRFEGMGAYGDSTDIQVFEKLGEEAASKTALKMELSESQEGQDQENNSDIDQPKQAPIFELRGMSDMFNIDQEIKLDNWVEKVTEIFKIINEVNQASYKPGGKPTIPPDRNNPHIWEKT